PFYTLGPLTTDIAPAYDHITSGIGAAMIADGHPRACRSSRDSVVGSVAPSGVDHAAGAADDSSW
ncbi:phosphomethylpyrimidine synthase ThiC, partial [Streptomyces sp. NPDC005921]